MIHANVRTQYTTSEQRCYDVVFCRRFNVLLTLCAGQGDLIHVKACCFNNVKCSKQLFIWLISRSSISCVFFVGWNDHELSLCFVSWPCNIPINQGLRCNFLNVKIGHTGDVITLYKDCHLRFNERCKTIVVYIWNTEWECLAPKLIIF